MSNRPRGSRHDREIDPIQEDFAQGISRQPAHLRFPGQLADAVNCSFSVVDGMSKRPGTHLFGRIGSPAMVAGGNYRLHAIDRDPTERYIVIYGEDTVRIFDTINGDEATVTIDSDSAKYLWANNATADDIRIRTKDDTTFIVNTLVPASSMRSDNYSVTSTVRDYDVLRSTTPADDTYHETEEDADSFPAGHFKYDVNGVTFAKVQFPAVSGDGNAWSGGYYNDASPFGGTAPLGFRIYFQTNGLSITNASYNNGTKTLTKTGAFAGFTFYAGARIKITGGTGVTTGWYEIASKVSDDAITTVADIGGASPADVSASSIASRHDVTYSVDTTMLEDMHAVAAKWQTALQASGAQDALCSWTETGYQAGYFTITSPYRGSGATVLDIGPIGTGTDATNGTFMFTASGATITAGTGSGSLTLDIDERWTEVAAPNQSDAELDPLTMPQQLVRTKKGPAATFSISPITWNARTSGDEDSNPSPTPISAALTGTISAISLASPGVATCVGHGLVTGDRVYIHSTNSTPVLDGERTVTRINDDTFSVGVNTTGAGTTGRWSKGATPIADVMVTRGRFALAIGDRFITSQAGDIYNFYIDNIASIQDSDPIEVPVGSDGGGNIAFMVESQRTVMLFTQAGVQYEQDETETLTPSTCRFTATTRHTTKTPTEGTRPKNLASVLYFAGDQESSSIVLEYRKDDLQAISTASDISKHVGGFLPTNVRTLVTAPSANRVFLIETDDRNVYTYATHWEGVSKKQSAWGSYQFDGNYRISDIAFLGERLWMLTENAPPATVAVGTPGTITLANSGLSNGDVVRIFDSDTTPTLDGTRTIANVSGSTFDVSVNVTAFNGSAGNLRIALGVFVLESMTTSKESVTPAELNLDAWAYAIHLDRQITLTGTYNAGGNYTEFTMPTGFPGAGSTLNHMVLGPAFGVNSGKEYGPLADNVLSFTYASTYIRVTGDYSAGEVVLGRFYTMSAEPTQPFVRDQNGKADRLSSLGVKRLIVGYVDSGSFTVSIAYPSPGPTTTTTTFTPTDMTETGELNARVYGRAEAITPTITSANAKPVTITGIQWIADYMEGVR